MLNVKRLSQVFSTTGKDSSNSVGTENGDTFVDHQGQLGTISANVGGRKMLGDLALTGNGVSAGDNDLGASANAYGHGELNGLQDNHIEPHGVQTTADVGGQSYTTNTGVDPDCVAKEGPCVDAGRRK
ncbi:hypothetical protein WJX73_004784 [Symbiochloris irregularis]|uniref:Uncharacterized protein n=1 Tax=Symbiochloris irregularis TaxID=706552 RepID=A0AAW1Q0H2_9CHLO